MIWRICDFQRHSKLIQNTCDSRGVKCAWAVILATVISIHKPCNFIQTFIKNKSYTGPKNFLFMIFEPVDLGLEKIWAENPVLFQSKQ